MFLGIILDPLFLLCVLWFLFYCRAIVISYIGPCKSGLLGEYGRGGGKCVRETMGRL